MRIKSRRNIKVTISIIIFIFLLTIGVFFYRRTHPNPDIEKIIKDEGCESVKRRIEITEGLEIGVKWKEVNDVIVIIISKKGEDKEEFSRQEYDVITETIDIVFSEYDYRVEWRTPIGNS